MEHADRRGSGASIAARMSLRRYKNQRNGEYQKELQRVLQLRVSPGMKDLEKRRLQNDQLFAREELAALRRGEQLSECDGLLAVRRSLYESEDAK